MRNLAWKGRMHPLYIYLEVRGLVNRQCWLRAKSAYHETFSWAVQIVMLCSQALRLVLFTSRLLKNSHVYGSKQSQTWV